MNIVYPSCMGLFNGLLAHPDEVEKNNSAPTNGQPNNQNPSPAAPTTIVNDPPITDEITNLTVPTPMPEHVSDPHSDIHRGMTPIESTTAEDKITPSVNLPTPETPHISAIPVLTVESNPMPILTSDPMPTTQPAASTPITLEDIQSQMDLINNFKKNPSVEALVALMYHKEEYTAALKNDKLDELLENIRKYNPLVKAFNQSSK